MKDIGWTSLVLEIISKEPWVSSKFVPELADQNYVNIFAHEHPGLVESMSIGMNFQRHFRNSTEKIIILHGNDIMFSKPLSHNQLIWWHFAPANINTYGQNIRLEELYNFTHDSSKCHAQRSYIPSLVDSKLWLRV